MLRKIILVGDAASGKTTFLNGLSGQTGLKLHIIKEEGWKKIPPKTEADKYQSNLWFTKYYYTIENRVNNKTNVVLERGLWFQYPFTIAQYKSGKITKLQKARLLELIKK